MYHLSRWTMVLSKSDQWGLPRDKHFKNYINWSNAKRSFKNYYDKNLRLEQFLIPEISNRKCWQSLWKTYRGLIRFYTLDHLKIYSKEGKKSFWMTQIRIWMHGKKATLNLLRSKQVPTCKWRFSMCSRFSSPYNYTGLSMFIYPDLILISSALRWLYPILFFWFLKNKA